MRSILLIVLCYCFTGKALAIDPNWSETRWRSFLDALRLAETDGKPNEGCGVVGDGDDAYGPYQIHKGYHQDACEFDKTLQGKWEDCLNDKAYSERVVKAYLRRYLDKGESEKSACRIHNGGPKGHLRKSTLKYLKRFLSFFKE